MGRGIGELRAMEVHMKSSWRSLGLGSHMHSLERARRCHREGS